MSLSTLLDRAEQAPRRTSDVQVLFDASIIDRLESLEREQRDVTEQFEQVDTDLEANLEAIARDLRNSDPRPAKLRREAAAAGKPLQARIDTLTAEIEQTRADAADGLVTFRFTALHGWEWAELTARSTPREGVAEDAGRPYNLDEVCKIAASRTGVIVTSDTTTEPVAADEHTHTHTCALAF